MVSLSCIFNNKGGVGRDDGVVGKRYCITGHHIASFSKTGIDFREPRPCQFDFLVWIIDEHEYKVSIVVPEVLQIYLIFSN